MYWFTANAPIRIKLLLSFSIMCLLIAAGPLASAMFGPSAGLATGICATGLGVITGLLFRRAISTPYVGTVVRMEALAAGDLDSPIAFTDYRDCVGRMTKAMFAFRDNARSQIAFNAEFQRNAEIVRGMTSNLKRLAAGDLTAEITEDYPPSYAELKTNFNTALFALRDLVGEVTGSSQAIRTGADEIARASEDLARRTEGNAASLEETSAAIAQMDDRLRATASAAADTVERANGAMTVVADGRTVAEQAVVAMGRVSDSAKGIDSVIEGLDKIAFQTRVLAMNAAVEAGRAGDAGRGFAVVADLVSALAMRSEEEAKRAREQLTTTLGDIITAVESVRRVDGALDSISGNVTDVHTLLGRIASDNQVQSTSVTQINAAVATMDRSTQQNAAMVEETSAAARNLLSEVTVLSNTAGRFQLNGDGRGSRTGSPRPIVLATAHSR